MTKILDAMVADQHGQCRLSVTSTTAIKLATFNGRNLNINGLPQQVPTAGVTATNGGLSASTLYYVYAYMNAGVMTLELSTTGHTQHTNGVEIKTGDSTRTLVGMVFTNGSTQFVDSLTSPTCLNWFNRRDIVGATSTVSGSTASTASFAEITASGQITFLAWPDEAVEIQSIGGVSNNTAGNIAHTTSPGLDGAAFGAQGIVTTFAASVSMHAQARAVAYVAEGKHVASTFGKVSAGTGTWNFGTQLRTRG